MSNDNDRVLLILTGGTIEKVHDPVSETFIFDEDHSPMDVALEESRAVNIAVTKVMAKDSLDVTDEDRAIMLEAISDNDDVGAIVLVHGTSTMVQTAKYLRDNGMGEKQTIVLTGAFRPFTVRGSDAKFNMGAAITASRLLEKGVYICMHGKVFDPAKTEKDSPNSRFLEV